jgi:hypothetical protein
MSVPIRLGRVSTGAVVEFFPDRDYMLVRPWDRDYYFTQKLTQRTGIVLRHRLLNAYRVADCIGDDGVVLTLLQESLVKVLSRADKVLGFTGTRSGMSFEQKQLADVIIRAIQPNLVVHGDCTGADTDFHQISLAHKDELKIRIRPCNHRSRAWNDGADEITEVKSPLVRNLDIVKDSSTLLAAPPTEEELRRSGTWHTVRAARRAEIPRIIVWPSGKVTLEGSDDAVAEISDVLKHAGVQFDRAR